MYCIHCKSLNKCSCGSCKKDKSDVDGYISYDEQTKLCICFYCKKSFSIDESENYEWDLMVENECKKLNEDICIEWIYSHINRNSHIFYKKYNIKEDIFLRMCFSKHFNIPSGEVLKNPSLLREIQINRLLK